LSTIESAPTAVLIDSLEPLAEALTNGAGKRPGLFITFEGIDGSGKSTQLKLLASRLRAHGREVLETAEPGGTAIGVQIRRILLDSANAELSSVAELLLMFACRAQNVEEAIVPALDQGLVVLCDRFTDSTVVYQGAARGLGADIVMAVDRIACQGLKPDLTLYIDIDVPTALERAHARNREGAATETRLDEQTPEFHGRVRDAYIELAAHEQPRIRIVDGLGAPEEVAERVWGVVSRAIGAR
jgi:dTMP kinase